MTFSIVACDLEEQTWGVAVASKFPAVGAVVPWAQADIGAVATQSFANTSFGPRGLALMGTGLSAQETLERLLERSEERRVGKECRFRWWASHLQQELSVSAVVTGRELCLGVGITVPDTSVR